MTSPFITPSPEGSLIIKQEPLDLDYHSTSMIHTPQPPTPGSSLSSLPSPVQLPLLMKYSRHDSPRSRTYEKPHSCCEVCQGEFTDQDMLLQHKLLHFNTSHVCYICDCYFVNTSTLIMHIATNHRNLNPAMTGRNDPDRSFVCSICLQRFSSNKTLQRHQETHKQQDERSCGCKICGLDFIGYRALVPHLNASRHKEMKIKIQSIFVCVDCRSVFPSRDSYAMHMMVRAQNETCTSKCNPEPQLLPSHKMYNYAATSSNGFLSGQNGVSSSTKTESRNDHLPLNLSMTAQMLKGLTCVKCGETVPDEEALALHIMIHVRESAEKPYYGRQSSLTHFLSHKLESARSALQRPDSAPNAHNGILEKSGSVWSCHICMKTFDICDDLAMHMVEKHSNGTDHENNNKNDAHADRSSIKETLNTIIQPNMAESNTYVIKQELKQLPMDQTCFSECNTPLPRKRRLSSDDEASQPKRCRSHGSGLFPCLYCSQSFTSETAQNSHVVDEHGVSLKAPCCLICGQVFVQRYALEDHLKSALHAANSKNQAFPCRACDFTGCSKSQINEHEILHGLTTESPKFTQNHVPQGSLAELLSDELQQKPRNVKNGVYDESLKHGADRNICDVENTLTEPNRDKREESTDQMNMENSKEAEVDNITVSSSSRRTKRKPRISSKFIPGAQSPSLSENDSWMDDSGSTIGNTPGLSPRHIPSLLPHPLMSMPLPVHTSTASLVSTSGDPATWPELISQKYRRNSMSDTPQRPSTTTGTNHVQTSNHDEESDVDLIDYVLSNSEKLCMCKYCKIIFTDQTMYFLHMGLHNLNNPWQCNLCGKASRNVHEFTSHVIHY